MGHFMASYRAEILDDGDDVDCDNDDGGADDMETLLSTGL